MGTGETTLPWGSLSTGTQHSGQGCAPCWSLHYPLVQAYAAALSSCHAHCRWCHKTSPEAPTIFVVSCCFPACTAGCRGWECPSYIYLRACEPGYLHKSQGQQGLKVGGGLPPPFLLTPTPLKVRFLIQWSGAHLDVSSISIMRREVCRGTRVQGYCAPSP